MEKTVKNTKDMKKTVKIISRTNCTIHPDVKSTRICEECDQPYCNDCVELYWTHNFLSYAYLGEHKDFTKHWLCKRCVKKKRRKGVMTAILILLGVFVIPIFVLIKNYHA